MPPPDYLHTFQALLLHKVGTVERRVDLALDALDEATAPAVDPEKPVVILLPGFMGAHLADAAGGRIWLDPAAALRGDLAARAALDANGTADAFPGQRVSPDGLVRLIYSDMLHALRAEGHAVLQFPFDFRRSLLDSTRLLRDLVAGLFTRQPTSRIVFLGHSMGALLACLLPEIMPEVVERIEQTIFLGAPLRGTFDAVESVIGTHWILPRLVSLSPGETSLDFQVSLATWPAVFGLLPDPVAFPDCASAFDATSWPRDVAVRQWMLDEARRVKVSVRESAVFQQPKAVIHLLATRYPTVGSLIQAPSGALAPGPRNSRGDGVVAVSAALVPGVIGYRTTFPHSLAPVEPAAIQAVLDLIRTGNCRLPPIDGPGSADPITPLLSPELDMAEGLLASGAQAMREGLLDFAALSWLLSPFGRPVESID